MNPLLKTTTILNLKREGKRSARFTKVLDEGEDYVGVGDVYMAVELFHELGSPDVITVTIEPGDMLNVEDA